MFGTVSSDDHYTGHKAAAFGGTTTVMDFVVLEDKGFDYSVDLWMKKAEKSAIDYSFHMNLTRFDENIAKTMWWIAGIAVPQALRCRSADGGRAAARQRHPRHE